MKRVLIIASAVLIMVSSCTSKQQANQQSQAAAAQAKQVTIDSMNAASQKQKTIDSLKTVVDQKNEQANVQTRTLVKQPVATTEKKKGWNNTTKGAVIGAGAGAVTGALVAKHKGAGAVVGGLLGAGAGAGTGAVIDNNKKKKGHQ